ncbi:hypothetical protein [Patulibacter defluvii]|uniref:hypothetical protein n=1 Tax=Patulibacter defluvii TaxID=3095358 RepID=UPI002A74CC72|nr:hypothetical protein [Patulibacter sp. DM4]
MAGDPPTTDDDEPTRVADRGPDPAIAPEADAVEDRPDGPVDAGEADVPPTAAGTSDGSSTGTGTTASGRLADKAAGGARAVGDRVTQAASATAQALRETDVHEIAHHTTNLIENARPFFLAAFAVAFSALAWTEDQTAVAVVFAVGAILFVLGAAYSREVDGLLTRGREPDGDGD